MITFLLTIGLILCALQAVRAGPLPLAALWLAGASAFTALILYSLAAREVAVIELSVGAGLVTILLVYSINLAGFDGAHLKPLVPRWLAGLLVIGVALLLLWFSLASLPPPANPDPASFVTTLWVDRELDAVLQIVLIFTTTLTVLGLLATQRQPVRPAPFLKPESEDAPMTVEKSL
jgi:NADH:ubiquinone oxidoreductase subunit 6 (subunit J)